MGKRYTSVEHMVNDLADKSFSREFVERSAKTRLSRTLFVLRNKAGLTQSEVGDRLGWTQSAVSKFEREEVDKIKFGDLERYLNAIDIQMDFSFFEKGDTVVDKVKYHVFETKMLLDRLATMVGEDEKILQEVSNFFAEYFINVTRFYVDSASRLPRPDDVFDSTMKFFDEYLEKVLPLLAEAEVADEEDSELDGMRFTSIDDHVLESGRRRLESKGKVKT